MHKWFPTIDVIAQQGARMRTIRRLPFIFILVLGTALMFMLGSPSMAKETDTDSPIGGVGGAVHADPFTGMATTSIPIDVVPGRNGVQPNLALTYASAGGNGWVGMGWKLEVGAIERQTRWGVPYLPTASDEQAGRVYTIRVNGVSADLVPAPSPASSDEYRAKIEGGFLRVKKLSGGSAGWEVTDKTGKKYLFGTTSSTRMSDPADATRIFKWCLERVEDRDGNFMTVAYAGDQGQAYLDHIDYTGNGATAPTNTVKFYLENRSDAPAMYLGNYLIKTAKRLKTIEVRANSALVRAYALTYSQSTSTSNSILVSIQQTGKDALIDASGAVSGGSVLPAITMGVSSALSNFSNATWSSFGSGGGDLRDRMLVGDFNGDGRNDLAFHAPWMGQILVGISTGTSLSWSAWAGAGTTDLMGRWLVGDFNGDGKSDLTYHDPWGGQLNVFISTGSTFGSAQWGNAGATELKGRWLVGDFNGDGKSDLTYHNPWGGQLYVFPSNGVNFGVAEWGNAGATELNGRWLVGDFNGDGRSDLTYHDPWGGQLNVFVSTGRNFGSASWGNAGATELSGRWLVGDFNGDGKSDLTYHNPWGGQLYVFPSTGSGFGSAQWGNAGATELKDRWIVGDFNGEGKHDLVYMNPWDGGSYMFLSDPNNPLPDLLTSLSNGLGGTTTITYVPSSQYTNAQLPYPVQTTATITTCDNWNSTTSACAGTALTTAHTYSGGYHHIGEREFRGFNYVKVTGPVGPTGEQLLSETWFHQGNDVAVGTNNPNVAHGYTKGLPYRTKVTDATGHVWSDATTAYLADADGVAPFFTPVTQVDASIDNGAKQTRTVYAQYDTYGNVLREDQVGDISTTTDDRTLIRTFANNTADWLLGFPTSETVYEGIGLSLQVAQTTLYYDGTASCGTASTNQTPTLGHLTRTVRWLNGGTNPETRMAYDAMGNILCTRDANGNTTTLTYDSMNTFAKTTVNPLGHVVTTQYYGVDGVATDKGLFGQVKSVTDPNNQTTTSEYDAFGRKSKTTTPDGLITTATYNYGIGFTIGTQHVLTSTSGAGLATALTSATYFDGLGRSLKKESTGPDAKIIVTEVQYDSRGAVRKKSLAYFKTLESVTGRWATTSYDALGRVVRMDSPDSTRGLACFADWVTVTIDAADHRKRETKDAYGRTVRVDEYQSTTSTCDTAVGTPYATTTYQYDVQGNLLSVTDAKGNVSTMTYDTLGRKTAMHDPDMGNWSYLYDAAGNLTKQTDAKGQVLWFQYDALNRRVQKDFTTQKAVGSGDVRYTYDGSTNNRKGRLQQVVDASGTVVFQYDGLGRITQSDKTLDGTTYTTQSTYDGLGRLLTVTYPSAPAKTISYAYNGPVLDKVFEGTTTYIQYINYNAFGQAGTTTYGNGVSTTMTYANASNTVCSQQNFRLCTLKTNGPGSGGGGGGGGSNTTYSAVADFSGTQGFHGWYYLSSTGAQLTWNGNFWSGTDGYIGLWNDGGHPGNSTDAVRRWVAPSAGSIQITGTTFDGDTSCGIDGVQVTIKKNGAVLWQQTIAAGDTTGYSFNLSNTVAMGDQLDFVTNKLTTSACDNTVFRPTIVLTTSGGGGGSSTTYSAVADFSGVQGQQGWYYLSSTGAQLTWNGNFWSGTDGYIGLWDDGSHPGNSTDAVRRWVAPSAGSVQITGTTFDGDTSCGIDGVQVTIKKNGAVLWQQTIAAGDTTGYSFNLSNTVATGDQLDFVTNKLTTSACDNTVFMPTIVLTTGSGGGGSSGTAYQDLRYVYTPDGNVSDIYDNLVAGGGGDQHLSYDSLSRLTLANGPYGTSGTNTSLTYTYDELGNLTFNTQVGTYTYPPSGSSSVRPHAVATAGSNTYSYDANGNLTSGAGRTLTYNLENKPVTVTTAGQTTTFVYDGDGERVKKNAGSTTTRYISKLYECDNTSCSRMIFAGGQRIATIGSGGATYYYHADHLGSSSVITDSTGLKVQSIAYYPYGAPRMNQSLITPVIDVPYKYTGKELDSTTNLYYYEARYYDATIGRFMSADTIVQNPKDPQTLNRYTYVRNNPYRYTDPTGQRFLGDVGKFLGRYVAPVVSGAIGYWVCGPAGPICAGAASGLTQAAVAQSEGKNANLVRGTLGGAAGVVAMGVANTLPVCAQLGGACGFAASGATYAAINKRDPREGAKQGLIGGAIALPIIVATSYINASGPSGSRELTPDEVELARSVFSEKVDLSSVRIYNSKYILLQGQRFAMAPDGNIYWPQDNGNMANSFPKLFIHEMTHVMQFQHGINVLFQGFLLQGAKYLSGQLYDPYKFSYDKDRLFSDYNIEQQGEYAVEIYKGTYPSTAIDY